MSFKDVLGHDRQVEVLRRNIATGQIPPTYLFHGDEGIGKRLVAHEFAKAVNCTGEAGPADSCGVCQNCRNIESGCHPNISMLRLEVNEKTDKMRQEIVIDQVRAAQDFLCLKAVGTGRKVLVVDGAHQMNEEAANAFLKTLEEPPENSHVILISSRPSRLLPTIHSRSRSISFQPLGEGLVAGLLMDRAGMSRADAEFVARMSGGRVGSALAADPAELMSRRAGFVKMLGGLASVGYGHALKEAEGLAKKEGAAEDFVFFGTTWFRDLLVILVGGRPGLAYNTDIGDELARWSGVMTAYRCEEALALLKEAGLALERTFNRRLLAEDLFFRLKEEVLPDGGPR